jgi:hypothetical protein
MAFQTANELIQEWFIYHSPTTDQVGRYGVLRAKVRELAELFIELSPQCADQTVALRMLRECNMMMNATIACNEKEGAK